MGQTNTFNIACPKCNHVQDVELYESINVSEAPELKAQLMNDQLNSVECAGCKFRFRVDTPLLYSDPDNQVMIYWLANGHQSHEADEERFRDSMAALNSVLPEGFEAPRVHLVFTRAELIERIFLLEAGLNERVIEYVKYMIYTRNFEKVSPEEKALLFNAQDSTPENLCFVVQDVETQKLEGMLQYSREAYDALCEMFDRDDETANLLELFPGPYISARALLLAEALEAEGEEE